MIKFFAFIGKILAALVGIRIGNGGIIVSAILFLWALSDVVWLLDQLS